MSEDAGQEAIDLAASVGLVLDPWQQVAVRTALSERVDGSWAASEVGMLVPRQNGKGAVLEALVLHGMFLVGDPLTLWTAHQTKTSAEAFLRIRSLIEGSEDLSRKVRQIHQANGDEGVSLMAGPRLRFVARSKSSGRGFSPQRIVFDEAQELSTSAVAAMLFSVSAQANPQLIFAGTVPGPENNSEHWTNMRDRGREGKSSRLAWLEWSPPGSDDPRHAATIDLDSREVWRWSNPAYGFRLFEGTVAGERESLQADPAQFAAERCNIWPRRSASSGVINMDQWGALGGQEPISDPLVLAVETDRDLTRATIVVVGTRPDGLPQGEIVASDAGTRWVPERVGQIVAAHGVAAVVVDGKSTAQALIPDIQRELGNVMTVYETTASDVAEACPGILKAIMDGTLRHTDDPMMTAAVEVAAQRPLGDGAWAWSRKIAGANIAPLVGLTLAWWKWREVTSNTYDPLDNIW